jgi:hypothetical protein
MIDLPATGHTWRGGGGPITVTPMIGVLLSLVLARWAVGVRLSPPLIGVCILLGTLFAVGADAWGMTLTTSAWLVAALFDSGSFRHTRGTFGRNPPGNPSD